eukprot:CAMPEP_0172746456 /NCGR_PEP_ID=MMETSP1074-20121228/140625_1 /TAXON_ID=2916 /ORGANISM="Ceratium fusus, Strain PA161109" /LENGTH=311 /DNA_ID=CAMNT_0013577825 /DNA_START=43 /DNA_END=978 /DNA_ORIENTATION=+
MSKAISGLEAKLGGRLGALEAEVDGRCTSLGARIDAIDEVLSRVETIASVTATELQSQIDSQSHVSEQTTLGIAEIKDDGAIAHAIKEVCRALHSESDWWREQVARLDGRAAYACQRMDAFQRQVEDLAGCVEHRPHNGLERSSHVNLAPEGPVIGSPNVFDARMFNGLMERVKQLETEVSSSCALGGRAMADLSQQVAKLNTHVSCTPSRTGASGMLVDTTDDSTAALLAERVGRLELCVSEAFMRKPTSVVESVGLSLGRPAREESAYSTPAAPVDGDFTGCRRFAANPVVPLDTSPTRMHRGRPLVAA